MTLKKAYEEIMDNVEVTPEMRGRVLRHIREAEAAGLRRRGVMAPGVRRVLAAAACLTVLIAGIALGTAALEARTDRNSVQGFSIIFSMDKNSFRS